MEAPHSIKRATVMDLTKGTPASKNPLWQSLIESFDTVMQRNVDEPTQQLVEVRHLRENFDREIWERTCRMLGFDITQDVLDLQTDLTKLTTQLPLYADYNGTYLFEKFVELLLNGECEIQHLWAEIYKDDPNFYHNWTNEPQLDKSKLVYRGGTWTRTTHIDLYIGLGIGATSLDNIVLKPGQTLFQRVIDLFFEYAPIALVIRQFWFLIRVKMLFRVGVVVPTEAATTYIRLRQDPPYIIQDGIEPGSRPVDSELDIQDYVRERVESLYGLTLLRAQMKEMDIFGHMLANNAVRSVMRAMDPENVPDADSTLPPFASFPDNELAGDMIGRRVICEHGPLAFDPYTSNWVVERDEGGFSIYAQFNLHLLNPVQWPHVAHVVVVIHYSTAGSASEAPAYFIEKSDATMFSNFRLKHNGPILSSLEHT